MCRCNPNQSHHDTDQQSCNVCMLDFTPLSHAHSSVVCWVIDPVKNSFIAENCCRHGGSHSPDELHNSCHHSLSLGWVGDKWVCVFIYVGCYDVAIYVCPPCYAYSTVSSFEQSLTASNMPKWQMLLV